MPYFKENSKELYLIGMNFTDSSDIGSYIQKIDLKIDFKLPLKHSSVITPQGGIYLIGGQEPDYSTNKLNKTYIFDPLSCALIRKNTMVSARASAASAYMQGNIYLIGGITTKEGSTAKCEKYTIKTDKWVQIGNLNTPCYFPNVCVYKDQCIYKFGGVLKKGFLNDQIEKYTPSSDKWTVVPFKGNIENCDDKNPQLGYGGQAVQFDRESVLIFGGRLIENDTVANYVMSFESLVAGGKVNKWNPGKIKEKFERIELDDAFAGVRYNNPIIQNDKIYCLRIVKDHNFQLHKYDTNWKAIN